MSSEKWSKAVSVEWAWRFPLWNFEIFPELFKKWTNWRKASLLQTFDNIGSKEIERLITGSSKSPDLKTGITFVIFHDRAKEPVANDLLKKRVIIGNDTGKRSFKNSRGYFIHTRGFIPG